MPNVHKESVENPVQNKNIVVGMTAVEVNPLGMTFVKGILVRAPGADEPVPNTAVIWLGNSNVTADSHLDTGGFPLIPGASLFLPCELIEGLYAISSAADQKLAWLGV